MFFSILDCEAGQRKVEKVEQDIEEAKDEGRGNSSKETVILMLVRTNKIFCLFKT